jgi:hypothetical protein
MSGGKQLDQKQMAGRADIDEIRLFLSSAFYIIANVGIWEAIISA